ncbi:hypothetical protein PoB_006330700 [Plakobranchus ocellatus]|uniref:Uncharacterized protein n=1 Tax=Plakobranchus ocellatus TaxID=259542 RepID=A0AAV4CY14_9GAST|nr:hypothetical protein PoB_006330700 [Plakobranchus ocellatus]
MSEKDSSPNSRWHPTPCQTEEPSEQATEPSASTGIKAFDSVDSPSHSIRLEYICAKVGIPRTIITLLNVPQHLLLTVDLRRDA